MENSFICNCCNQKDNFNNSLDHLKNCLYNSINNNYNDVYIFLVENNNIVEYDDNDDYTINKDIPYWLYFSIYKNSNLSLVIDILKEKWLKCCDEQHIETYNFGNCSFASNNNIIFKQNKINNFRGEYSTDVQLDILFKKINDNCILEFDSVLTTNLSLTLVDIIKSPNKCKIKNKMNLDILNEKILLQNEFINIPCSDCNTEINKTKFCPKCKNCVCDTCITGKVHPCYKLKSKYMEVTNDPRTCIQCHKLNIYKNGKLAENLYDNANLMTFLSSLNIRLN